MVEKFLAHGSAENLMEGRYGRRKTKRTPDEAEKIRKVRQRNPNKSLRRLSQELSRSTTAHRLARTVNYFTVRCYGREVMGAI